MNDSRVTVVLEVKARDVGWWLQTLEWVSVIDVLDVAQNCPGHSATAEITLRSEIFPPEWEGASIGAAFHRNGRGEVNSATFSAWANPEELDTITITREQACTWNRS